MTDPRMRDQNTSIRYCRYCGIAPTQSDFERHQDRCKNHVCKVGDNGVNSGNDIALAQQRKRAIAGSFGGTASRNTRSDPSQFAPPPLSRGYVKSVDGCHELYHEECVSVRKIMSQVGIVDHYHTGASQRSEANSANSAAIGVPPTNILSNTESTLGKMTDLMLVKAVECFAKSMVDKSMAIFSEERKREQNQVSKKRNPQTHRATSSSGTASSSSSRTFSTQGDESGDDSTARQRSSADIDRKILTPFHVYKAIVNNPGLFDFLANK